MPKVRGVGEDASGLRGAGSYAAIMQNKTYSMNVFSRHERATEGRRSGIRCAARNRKGDESLARKEVVSQEGH